MQERIQKNAKKDARKGPKKICKNIQTKCKIRCRKDAENYAKKERWKKLCERNTRLKDARK